jgi:pSer/pThr/pTyr-binding forkhead associated (FHA) protein
VPEAFLIYRDAADAPVIVDLAADDRRLIIGRRRTNDIVLDWDPEISRVHAALDRMGEDWTVVDEGLSLNGSYLNGTRITSRTRLRDGDVLSVGSIAIVFRTAADSYGSHPTDTALGPRIGARLTPAQRRVLTALCRPLEDTGAPATNKQIATELVVGVDAVKSTLHTLFELFGIEALPQNRKRASLARCALHTGAITRRELERAA